MRRLLKFTVLMLIGTHLFTANGLNTVEYTFMKFSSIRNSSLMNRYGTVSHDNSSYSCEICHLAVSILQTALSLNMSTKEILATAANYCIETNIQTPHVCNGVVYALVPDVIAIMKSVNMSAAQVCYLIFDDSCNETAEHPSHIWKISLPSLPKPALQTIPLPQSDVTPQLKVLHLTDTHYDPLYLVGSNADCPEPMCCRANSSIANSFHAAGKWGAFKCDVPKQTFEHLLDFILKNHKDIDYVIWTGDILPHDVWNGNKDKVIAAIEESIQLVKKKLPGVLVFPAIGNHERIPVNLFPTIEQDSSMLTFYNEIDRIWRNWLPASTSKTVRRGAYYSVAIRPGFRIISLNMNVCYNFNFWLVQNSMDPMWQLQWLINELQKAETAREKVHIIGHIPPGSDDCFKIWSHNYYKIVTRYENTIMAQFFGHTHHDEIQLFFDPKCINRVTNIAYISPSLTPFDYGNPAFRFYYIDGDHNATTRLVLDHETWTMDLSDANLSNNIVWRKSYSARDAYAMLSLRPADWNNFIRKITHDDALFDVYFKNYWVNSPFQPKCSPDCKQTILCQAKSGRSHDKNTFCS